MADIYDDRDYDASVPNTATEELLAMIHILYKMFEGDYASVDKWLLTSNDNLSGDVPIDQIRDGSSLYILEYLRDIENKRMRKVNGGDQ